MVLHLVKGAFHAAGAVGTVAGAVSTAATVTSALGTVGQVATAIDSVTGNPAFDFVTEIGEKAADAAADYYAETKNRKSPVNHTKKKNRGYTGSPVNRETPDDDDGNDKLRAYTDKTRAAGRVCGKLHGGATEGPGAGAFCYGRDEYRECYHKT